MIHRTAIFLLLLSCLCFAQAPNARSEVNAGVQSYKNARYEEAIDHFRRAVELDPTLLNARVYLATAYAMQYVPGADTEDNLRIANSAIEQYKKVLEADPRNVNSVKGIAYLYLNMKKFEEAKKWYNKGSEIEPNDPEIYYSVGVIDWTISYESHMKLTQEFQPPPPNNDESFTNKPECLDARDKYLSTIEDGIQQLTKALELRKDYDDAMAYMNLLYRERARLQCGNPRAFAEDIDAADKWVDLTIATKKKKAEAAEPKRQ